MGKDNIIKPINYEIVFEPNLSNFRFHGKEKIKLAIKEPTDKIVLNAIELKINDCYLKIKKETLKPSVKLDERTEELILKFSKRIKGEAELFIDFKGILNDKLAGFYRSQYQGAKGNKKFLATTHFEPADARRAFPCFDEPESKATFDISVILDKDLTAVSNTNVIEEKIFGRNKKIVKFARTPLMSTYLLHVSAGEFEFVADKLGKIIIRVYTTPGKKEQGKLALEFAKKFLNFYQDYFKIKYLLPKLDLIALPDLPAGAMENWGAITFAESALLFDPKSSSAATKQRVAEVVSHELAHQWFGNLVTMRWWNDLWLNESFANLMSYKIVNHFYPEWEVMSQYLNSATAEALSFDALKSSHPIEVDVKNPSELNEIFDDISYDKGGSILRMLENYLGEEVFRKGLSYYLAKHKYGNATTNDLWLALSKVSKKPVKKIMDSWIRQQGYPIVAAELIGKKLKLTQKRFLLEDKKSDKTKWLIPLSLAVDGHILSDLFKDRTKVVDLDKEDFALKVNFSQTGFYRVKYSKELLNKLKKLVESKILGNLDRWGIQHDLFALALSGHISIKEYFDFIKSYANEDDYLVVKDIMDNLSFLYIISVNENFGQKVIEYDKEFVSKVFRRLGWEPKPDEKHTDTLLRGYAIAFLGKLGDEKILDTAKEKFEQFLKNPDSLHPDLRSAVYSLVAWAGDDKTYELIENLYLKAKTQEEQKRFLSALANLQKTELLERTLNFSLSPEVRSHDTPLPIIRIAYNPFGRKIIWSWFKKNFSELKNRYKRASIKLLIVIVGSLDILATVENYKDVSKFLLKNSTDEMKKSVAQTLERMRIYSKFLQRLRKDL